MELGERVNFTVQIPDDLALRLGAGGSDLSRRALEALAAEEYRQNRITRPELQRLLGLVTSLELDEFLKIHEVVLRDPHHLSVFEQGLGMFGSTEDAALLDEVVSIAYEERRRPTQPAPSL
jgi:hypothetical protein